MDEGGKKTPGNRSISQRKKSSRSKCKLTGKRNSSSISRRRKKKSLAKLVSQNSIDNVHCFPIPFADFFCGCAKDCGKDKNKIKRISSKQLSKVVKAESQSSIKSDKVTEDKCSDEGEVKVEESQEETKEEEIPVISNDAFAGLTEPLDFDKLKLNGNMKNLLANVKFTSIFGCANVPRTMSQIKILLDNNPALKTQLKHILGDNLKNENMKPVVELLASDKEESVDKLSNDSSIRRLSISKSFLEAKYDCVAESVNSSFILSKKGDAARKSGSGSEAQRRGSVPRSKNTRRKGSSHRSNGSESQLSLFAKIFSSVFRPTKPTKSKRKKSSSIDTEKKSKKSFPRGDVLIDDENMKDMREKYDEWYKRSPEDVRERFRWEDYVRVTMYLNDIREANSSNDEKAKEMLNLWLTKFNKEMNRLAYKGDGSSESPVVESIESSEQHNIAGKKLKRIISEEMLNAGGGDVICRLNSLMKELVESTENCDERPHADAGGDGEDGLNLDPELPGCSKWFEHDVTNSPDEIGKDSTTTDKVSIYQMMCASFVDKLSKHGSKESKSILESRYTSEMPWQNKDFQVFYVPTIQTRFTLDNLKNKKDYGCFEDRLMSSHYDTENSSDESEVQENSKMNSEDSRATLESRDTDAVSDRLLEVKSNFSLVKNDTYEGKDDVKSREMKTLHQKRVSFNDNLSHDNLKKLIGNGHTKNYACEASNDGNDRPDEVYMKSDQNEVKESVDFGNISELHVPSVELSSAITTCSSASSDLNYILQHTVKNDNYKESRETLKYIKEHKCELVEILKYLLLLANQNPTLFESIKDNKSEATGPLQIKACVGIQCKISEEVTGKSVTYSDSSIRKGSIPNFQHLLKCHSETGPKKVKSESGSSESDNVKLISSLSDSGVHSNSSTSSHRRQFISLPDVLEGAPVALGGKVASNDACKQSSVDSMKRKESSSSNLLASCLSTSVSCQASQTPDVDDFSQVSASDLSETQCRVLETRSSTTFKHEAENISSSEKSRSSENTRSCPETQEGKPSRIRIKNIFRRKTIKETKK